MLLLSQILNKLSADLNHNSMSRHQMAAAITAAIPYSVGASDDYICSLSIWILFRTLRVR